MRVSRNTLFRPLLAAAISQLSQHTLPASALQPAPTQAVPAEVTARVFLDLRIINSFSVEVLEDAATRGRVVIGLFGKDAPLAVQRFIEFTQGTVGQYSQTGGGPAYSQATFDKLRPGELLEGGKIAGLRQTTFAGSVEWEYMSRLLPLRPALEVNELRHDRRGVLTRLRFNAGPEFGITLAAAPQLDSTYEVFGQVEQGFELLDMIEQLPFITGKSLETPGSLPDQVFAAQKSLFSGLAKSAGDSRAEDRTGKLLRRVEITQCGLL